MPRSPVRCRSREPSGTWRLLPFEQCLAQFFFERVALAQHLAELFFGERVAECFGVRGDGGVARLVFQQSDFAEEVAFFQGGDMPLLVTVLLRDVDTSLAQQVELRPRRHLVG